MKMLHSLILLDDILKVTIFFITATDCRVNKKFLVKILACMAKQLIPGLIHLIVRQFERLHMHKETIDRLAKT